MGNFSTISTYINSVLGTYMGNFSTISTFWITLMIIVEMSSQNSTANDRAMFVPPTNFRFAFVHQHVYTPTHTHIYIYIYTHINMYLRIWYIHLFHTYLPYMHIQIQNTYAHYIAHVNTYVCTHVCISLGFGCAENIHIVPICKCLYIIYYTCVSWCTPTLYIYI